MTASVLWAITILNFNRALENLRTINNFNFTNIFSDRVMGCSTEGPVAAFAKRFQTTSFRKYLLLINFISFSISFFPRFLLLEDFGECALRKEPVIAPFVERFETAALRNFPDEFH